MLYAAVARRKPAFIVQYGFACVVFMLKEQILLHLSVVTVFYGYMLQDSYEAHLSSFSISNFMAYRSAYAFMVSLYICWDSTPPTLK